MTAAGWAAIAAWIALLPIAAAAVRAYIRSGQAENAADRAEQRAEAALEQYQRMADALERMAEADAPGADPSLADAVSFVLERGEGTALTLRNLGPGPATQVRIDEEQALRLIRPPDGIDLAPMQGCRFGASLRTGSRIPTELRVICDQIPDGVIVPLPGRG